MLHLSRPCAAAELRLKDVLELRVGDLRWRNFRIYAARGYMSVDEHLNFFRHAEKIQRWIAIEVSGDLVDEAEKLRVPKDIGRNLRPVFQDVKRLVKHAELIDEIGPDL